MKKHFMSIAVLCSAFVLSSSMNAMDNAVAIPKEEAQAATEVVTKATLKGFSSRLHNIESWLDQIETKVAALKKNEGDELTPEGQAEQTKVALFMSKLPEIKQDINTIRDIIKQVYPDSWVKWVTKWMSNSTTPANLTDEDIFKEAAAILGGLNLFIDEFNKRLVTIKAQATDNEALLEKLDTIEATLKDLVKNSSEVINTLTPKATLASMVSTLLSRLFGSSTQ